MYIYYFDAAFCRQADLDHLKKNTSSMIFSIYCAGVAVECMLRAYITRYTAEFDAKHDLEKLLKQSQMNSLLSVNEKAELAVAIKRIKSIWSNDLRYFSEARIKKIIGHEFAKQKAKNLNKFLQKFYSEIFDLTNFILQLGKTKWT